ncbi:MAG: hypothetical protein HQK53_09500, partial [Oligoflexia bacterium]|nr:hypothetical protein [Oligoflexia bacterium]
VMRLQELLNANQEKLMKSCKNALLVGKDASNAEKELIWHFLAYKNAFFDYREELSQYYYQRSKEREGQQGKDMLARRNIEIKEMKKQNNQLETKYEDALRECDEKKYKKAVAEIDKCKSRVTIDELTEIGKRDNPVLGDEKDIDSDIAGGKVPDATVQKERAKVKSKKLKQGEDNKVDENENNEDEYKDKDDDDSEKDEGEEDDEEEDDGGAS